jgi:1,4-alpha-glucan branching enzyme
MTVKQARPKGRRKVQFRFKAEPGTEVHVAGTFNDWDPKHRRLTDPEGTGVFTTAMLLAPGFYQYKFGNGVMNSALHVIPAHPPAVLEI